MYTLNCKGRLLVLKEPIVMGIINCTPDSFYSGSRTESEAAILQKATQMIKEGAAILDIGGQSTRPGSSSISIKEESTRVLPAITLIKKHFPDIFLSIDTYNAVVAKEAIAAGAEIVNDVSAGEVDTAMITTIAALKVPFIAMHMRGTPATMQQNPVYKNVTAEVVSYFIKKTDSLKQAGITDVILDPGFGFGKTATHNFQLLKELDAFHIFQKPLLAGLSRKATIYKTLGVDAEHALNGTTVLNTIALTKGANILRVHDVKEAKEAVTLFTALQKA